MKKPTLSKPLPTVVLSVRLPKRLHAELKRHAKAEHSSLNRHIILCLAQAALNTRNLYEKIPK